MIEIDAPTLNAVVGSLILILLSIIAWFLKRLIDKFDNLDKRLHDNITDVALVKQIQVTQGNAVDKHDIILHEHADKIEKLQGKYANIKYTIDNHIKHEEK